MKNVILILSLAVSFVSCKKEELKTNSNWTGPGVVFIPRAFSPNNDGYNDLLRVKFDQFFTTEYFSLKIFDSLTGKIVFETDDLYSAWDGSYKGHLMPEANYKYIVKFSRSNGESAMKMGSVELVR